MAEPTRDPVREYCPNCRLSPLYLRARGHGWYSERCPDCGTLVEQFRDRHVSQLHYQRPSGTLTAGALRRALEGLDDGVPVKFNLSRLAGHEAVNGGHPVRSASVDRDGRDGSVVIDLGPA